MTDLPLKEIRKLVAELRTAYDRNHDVKAAIEVLEAAVAGDDEDTGEGGA